MDISKMSIPEIEARLEELWNTADKLPNGSKEYKEIVDEVLKIRRYTLENHVELSESIAARF